MPHGAPDTWKDLSPRSRTAVLAHLRAHAVAEDDLRKVTSLLDTITSLPPDRPRRALKQQELAALLAARRSVHGWAEVHDALAPALAPPAPAVSALPAPLAVSSPPAPPLARPPTRPPPPLHATAADGAWPARAHPEAARVSRARIPVTGPLYLAVDEYWPPDRPNEGVIAGFALTRGLATTVGWPVVRNHLERHSRQSHAEAVRRVFQTRDVVPFVLPMRVPGARVADRYDALIDAALLVLLGWVLAPDPSVDHVQVHVVLGEVGGILPGETRTARFQGLIEGLSLVNPERFRAWRIREVRFTRADDVLIAYADAVSKLAHAHNAARQELARELKLRDAPGYFELSTELLPTLLRLEQMERAGNVRDILDLGRAIHGSRLLAGVFDDLRARIASNAWLRTRLLAEVNARFDRDDLGRADVEVLQDVARALIEPQPGDPLSLQALHAALRVQDANREGAPERVRDEVFQWQRLAVEARRTHPVAALLLDLHLAVHLNDRGEFEASESLMAGWIEAGDERALSPQHRAWLRSSLGQSLAYQERHADARTHFDAALLALRASTAEPDKRARDLDQTGSLRALNAVCEDPYTAESAVTELLGPLDEAAASLASSDDPRARLRHHLLARWMYDSRHEGPAWRAYLSARDRWWTGEGPPWPLIAVYRALLLHRDGLVTAADAAAQCAHAATLATGRGGAWGRVTGAALAVVACCLDASPERVSAARAWVDAGAHGQPSAEAAMRALRGVAARPSGGRVDEALRALPFNLR